MYYLHAIKTSDGIVVESMKQMSERASKRCCQTHIFLSRTTQAAKVEGGMAESSHSILIITCLSSGPSSLNGQREMSQWEWIGR